MLVHNLPNVNVYGGARPVARLDTYDCSRGRNFVIYSHVVNTMTSSIHMKILRQTDRQTTDMMNNNHSR